MNSAMIFYKMEFVNNVNLYVHKIVYSVNSEFVSIVMKIIY